MPAVLFPLELHRRRKGGYKIENNQKYNIIYADPPWRYQQKNLLGAAEHHYSTMSVKDICGLKVEEIAAKDCVLFLWATFPQLPEALRVIKAWGFQYKTVAFVWLKQNKSGKGWFFGLGFWTRGNAEICLLAIKGKPHRNSNRVHQFLISPIRGHSQKPEEAREKIVELMGDLPRVELFACIIFSLFAAAPPVVNPDAAAVTMVWSYVGELIFNMLILVGAVKMADRVVREMMGL